MAVSFGSSPALGTWFTSVYSLGGTIAFMLCGANSDLFGRRTFILLGNLLMIIGAILGGTSHTVGRKVLFLLCSALHGRISQLGTHIKSCFS